jgi:hypothetical protein
MLESVTPKRDKSKKGVNKKQAKHVSEFSALLERLGGCNLKADINDTLGDGCIQTLASFLLVERRNRPETRTRVSWVVGVRRGILDYPHQAVGF